MDNLIEHMNMLFVTCHFDFMNKCSLCRKKITNGQFIRVFVKNVNIKSKKK